MWLLAVGILVVVILLAITVAAWWMTFRDARPGDLVCPRCRSRMIFGPATTQGGPSLWCASCKEDDPLYSGNGKGWAQSKLREPT
jgi:hypothetical protein